MKFIKLHQNDVAFLVNMSNISEVHMTVNNRSSLYFIPVAGDRADRMTVDESIDEIFELIKQVND